MIGSGALLATATGLWVVAGAVMLVVGLRRSAAGATATREAQMTGDLLAGAPAVPLLVHHDGSLDADPRVANWLGLDFVPLRLEELGGENGFTPDDMAQLSAAIMGSTGTGRPVLLRVGLGGTARRLEVRGGPYAVAGARRPSTLLWLLDISETQHELIALRQSCALLERTIDGLSALIEAAPFPMWYRAADLSLALVNGAYVAALEDMDAARVIAEGAELVERDDGATARAAAAAAQASGAVQVRAAPVIVAGKRRMMRVADVPIAGTGVAGYAIDIQDLEDARGELAMFGQAQRDLLDRLSVGVAQFGADRGLTFTNHHFQRLFAISRDWLADAPDFDRLLDRMREMQRAPEARDFPNWRAERRGWFLLAGAQEESWLLPGGTHLRVVAQPLPDGGLLLIFDDQTAQLQLASARDTLLRVRTATFDALFEAVGVFAADGRLQLWNARFREVWDMAEAELAARPRIDALARTIASRLADPTRADLIREHIRIATNDRQYRSGRIALADGRQFEFAAVPLPDGNALFTLLDVTDSRQIEEALRDRAEALEQANRLKNAFVASMSYELRVPLTSIAGFAEMLAGGYAGELSGTVRDYVAAILSGVARLSSLMGDVLDLAQSEAGTLPVALEAVALTEISQAAAERIYEPARNAGLTLAADVASDCGTILADAKRLAHALDHLLRNAVGYTPPGGRVLVRCRAEGGTGEIVISDNGAGISAGQLDNALARFSRSTIGPTDDPPSGGFGLPLARQLIEAQGGTLLIDSEPGRGTSVTVRLPLISDAGRRGAA